jgi:two-component system LytT family response regulator
MIKALIIDDELVAANVLRMMLERHIPEISDLRIATQGNEAIALLQTFAPQLVFLDIVMPELNGFQLLGKMQGHQFEVIFTTAYNEYAIQAIRFSALDYLLKPIDAEELKEAIRRYKEKLSHKAQAAELINNLQQNLQAQQQSHFKLAIPGQEGAIFFSPAEIIRCEGDSNYTWFHLTDNRKHLSSKTIKEYEEILTQHNFLRIHKSHLVNKSFIQNYLNEGAVILSNKQRLPVSRQRKDAVKAALGTR